MHIELVMLLFLHEKCDDIRILLFNSTLS
jgi:hypothetical protein